MDEVLYLVDSDPHAARVINGESSVCINNENGVKRTVREIFRVAQGLFRERLFVGTVATKCRLKKNCLGKIRAASVSGGSMMEKMVSYGDGTELTVNLICEVKGGTRRG